MAYIEFPKKLTVRKATCLVCCICFYDERLTSCTYPISSSPKKIVTVVSLDLGLLQMTE